MSHWIEELPTSLTSRVSLPGLDTFIVLNVPKILNILEIVHPLPTTHIEPIILMSSLNCAIINRYKIASTQTRRKMRWAGRLSAVTGVSGVLMRVLSAADTRSACRW